MKEIQLGQQANHRSLHHLTGSLKEAKGLKLLKTMQIKSNQRILQMWNKASRTSKIMTLFKLTTFRFNLVVIKIKISILLIQ